jgi:hypothetical protein
MKPQPSPADTLRRVIKIARVDGLSIFVVSGGFALITMMMGDLIGTIVGLFVAAAGWSEWHGAKLLQRGRARGIGWLVRSQLYLLSIILLYVMRQMTNYDPEYVRSLVTPQMKQMFDSVGLDLQQVMPMVRTAFYVLYGTVALVTLIYQGGLALYYRRRTEAVYAALDKTHLPK